MRETRLQLPRVQWFDEIGSTNAAMRELVVAEGGAVPHGALIATANQTAGRGRQGRGWVTPPGTALASSLLVRGFGVQPALSLDEDQALPASWLPLIAGSAVAAALRPCFAAHPELRVGVKWPNDVHVRDEDDAIAGRPGAKLAGILCEVLAPDAIVVGVGINLLIPDWQLPTERAGSVLACGGDVAGAESLDDEAGQSLADRVLSSYAAELLHLVQLGRGEPNRARARVLRDSLTIGSEVRVHLPGGEMVDGRAVGLDENGALLVDRPTTGRLIVNAADVEHLR